MEQFSRRIAQMDLARQMEPVEFIRNFIDLLSANRYNMLMLYLEARIITPSFPYPAPNEGYTMDQIRDLVSYGASKGIELFPCIATLGHAELFLKYPEMQKYAEIKDGLTGRFGGTRQDSFCVSEPGFYDFLFKYLEEVASLFPSEYFHIGLDEFWDFNRCPRCRAQAPDFAGEEQLFLKHIMKVRDFLKKLGKRTAMWTDMLENYTDILPDIPRDVIMVEWQYQSDVRFTMAHFNNCAVTDNLHKMGELGFEIWLAPCDMQLTNLVSTVEYARTDARVKGILLTSWERSDLYWPRYLPMFALGGRLLTGETLEEVLPEVSRQLFGVEDPRFDQLLNAALSQFFTLHFKSCQNNVFFSRHHLGLDTASHQALRLIWQELKFWQSRLLKGQNIWSDLIQLYDEIILSFKLKKSYLDCLDFGVTPRRLDAIREDTEAYRELFRDRTAQWEQQRPGITPNTLALKWADVDSRLDSCQEQLRAGNFLKLRLMHADWYGAPRITVSLKLDGEWHQIQDGVLKPDNLREQLVEYFIPVPEKLLSAQAMKIQCCGYGGVGIAYAELRKDSRTLQIPDRITGTENTVTDPENVLQNNSCWSFLGDQQMHKVFCNQELARIKSGIEFSLKKYI